MRLFLLVILTSYSVFCAEAQKTEYGILMNYGVNYTTNKVVFSDLTNNFKAYNVPNFKFQFGAYITLKNHYHIECNYRWAIISIGYKYSRILNLEKGVHSSRTYSPHNNFNVLFGYNIFNKKLSIMPYIGINYMFDNNYNTIRGGYSRSGGEVYDSTGTILISSDSEGNDSAYMPRKDIFGVDMGIRLNYKIKMINFMFNIGYTQGLSTYFYGRYYSHEYRREPYLNTGMFKHSLKSNSSYLYMTAGISLNIGY